ncbi:MAG: diguanylate cyclase [Magnetococcales bacterium]|nr:diguanylate cyclase [Magnetococcales bacterium]
MLTTRFLRSSFFLSVILVVLIPVHALWVTHPAFRDLLIRFTEENAVRLANRMADSVVFDASTGKPLITNALRADMAQLAKGFQLYKYRLFDAQGSILLSSVEGDVGTINKHDYFHQIVAQGRTHSLTVKKNHPTLEQERFQRDVVETYVPIMRDNHFSGAFELYSDITEWLWAMEWIVSRTSWVLGGMAMVLLLVIVVTRSQVMRRVGLFTHAMAATALGEFQHRLFLSGRDELTDMALNFNRMSDELHKLHWGLQNEKNKLTTIILSAREGIVVTDDQGQVVLVNPAAERLLGKSGEQVQREGFVRVVDDPEFVGRFLEQEGVDMPETLVFNQHVLQFYASTIRNREGERIGSAALMRDITEEKKLEEKLRNQSITDALTTLFNRRHAMDILGIEWQRCQRTGIGFAFALLDVDFFKRFNDEYGHDQGDRVLKAVARSLLLYYRQIDVCCRHGGEEFCVIMPGTTLAGAVLAAERLRQGIERMRIDGLQVTVSIGVTVSDPSMLQHDDVVKRADVALYAAKHGGRNRVVEWNASFEPTGKPCVAPSGECV